MNGRSVSFDDVVCVCPIEKRLFFAFLIYRVLFNIFVNCFQQENEKQGRSNSESLEPPTKTSLSSINSIGASSDRHDGAQSLNNIFKGFQNEAYNSSPVRKVSF